jgi:hypothetical protein
LRRRRPEGRQGSAAGNRLGLSRRRLLSIEGKNQMQTLADIAIVALLTALIAPPLLYGAVCASYIWIFYRHLPFSGGN